MLVANTAEARDGFDSIHCSGDVRSALVGKRMGDEPAAEIEKRHADLGLKDLGGDEISDSLNSTSWRICAKEYVVLSDSRGTVRDVLIFPTHSKAWPQFSGICQASGKKVPGAMIGVLDNRNAKGSGHYSTQDEMLLGATAAWRIDEKARTFVPLRTAGLFCPRSAISTADGGP